MASSGEFIKMAAVQLWQLVLCSVVTAKNNVKPYTSLSDVISKHKLGEIICPWAELELGSPELPRNKLFPGFYFLLF